MNKKKIPIYIISITIGAVLIYLGGFVLVEEELKMFSGLCIGVGSAAFGLGGGNFLGALILSETDYQRMQRQKDIEVKDERNQKIKERVEAKSNQIIFYLIIALVLILGFINADRTIIIMVSSLLFIHFLLRVALMDYYSKKM